MPVRTLAHAPATQAVEALKQRLINEWRNPHPQGQPDIVLDRQPGPAGPVHVFVIWDEWDGLSQIERSEIITDAYEAVHGQAEALQLTVAMGMTSQEAARFGLPLNR